MTRKIGFVGGGQMAEAIIKGLLQSHTATPDMLGVFDTLESRQSYLQQNYQIIPMSMQEVVERSDVLLLGVKPQVMGSVLEHMKEFVAGHLIVTIAAGLPISFYEHGLARYDLGIIRVMPNVAALVQQSATAICRNSHVSDNDFSFVKTLFDAIGITIQLGESQMDAVTALSGSGPAYVFCFVSGLIDAGVKVGLSRDDSKKLVIQTIKGSISMLEERDVHPAILKDQVTSPAGTTASGLHVLDLNGFSGLLISAVENAFQRAKELGE